MRGHYYCSHTQYRKPFTQITETVSHKLLKCLHTLLKTKRISVEQEGEENKRPISIHNYGNTTPMSTLALEVTIQTLLQGSNSLLHPGHGKLHHVSCTYNLERRLSDSTSAINAAGMGKFLSWREGKRDSTWLSSTSTLAAFEFWWSLPRLIYFTLGY